MAIQLSRRLFEREAQAAMSNPDFVEVAHWFCLRTKPMKERYAAFHLERQGLEAFFPRLRLKKTIRRKYGWVVRPMFPNYLFARLTPLLHLPAARHTIGVTNIVSFHGYPVPIDPDVVGEMQAHAPGAVVTFYPPQELKPGDRVRIKEGPFQGLQGIFERELTGEQRVAILLEAVELAGRMELDRWQVEPA